MRPRTSKEVESDHAGSLGAKDHFRGHQGKPQKQTSATKRAVRTLLGRSVSRGPRVIRTSNLVGVYRESPFGKDWREWRAHPQLGVGGEEGLSLLQHQGSQRDGIQVICENAITKGCLPGNPQELLAGEDRSIEVLLGNVDTPITPPILQIPDPWGDVPVAGTSLWLYQFDANHGQDYGPCPDQNSILRHRSDIVGGRYCSHLGPTPRGGPGQVGEDNCSSRGAGIHHQQGEVLDSSIPTSDVQGIPVESIRPDDPHPSGQGDGMEDSCSIDLKTRHGQCEDAIITNRESMVLGAAEPVPYLMVGGDASPHLRPCAESWMGSGGPYPTEGDGGTPPLAVEERDPAMANVVVARGRTDHQGRCWPHRIRHRRSLGDCWVVDPIPSRPEYQLEGARHVEEADH